MKKSSLIVALIILMLIILPGKYSFFEIDINNPIKPLLAFLVIIAGVIVASIIDSRSGETE